MTHFKPFSVSLLIGATLLLIGDAALAQEPPPGDFPGFPGGRGFGPPPGMGMMGQERKLVKQFDKDGDKRLNKEERQTAREFLKKEQANGGGRGGFPPRGRFGPPGFRRNQEPPQPGRRLSPADVKSYPDAKLYEPTVLRTLFLDFENSDWEAELTDFHGTDVEVPATLTVDGKKYEGVGIHFRGMSSYMMVSPGYKRSLNVSVDYGDSKSRLYGYKTLNLLNAHEDPTFMSSVLYSAIARKYTPAPKANFVRVVINGENWGVYSNVQQFDKIFTAENFQSDQGTRWKVKGSPMGRGGLEYLGEDIEAYKRIYEIKSADDEKAWKAFIRLCKTLNQTPVEQLEEALKPMLDLDSALWFLALDVALINSDGYWIRASDYSLYLDEKGKFHLLPHDMNEAFHGAGGPGFGPPGGGRGGFPGGFPGGPPPDGFGPPPGFPPDGGGNQGAPGGFPPQGARPRPDGRNQPQPGDGNQANNRRPMGGMRNARGMEIDPLVGLDDTRKPLRSRLLKVPALQAQYLRHIYTIARDSLAWSSFGALVAQNRTLIQQEVERDTRKLETFAEFVRTTADKIEAETPNAGRPGGMNLKAFAERRRNYLLSNEQVKRAAAERSANRN